MQALLLAFPGLHLPHQKAEHYLIVDTDAQDSTYGQNVAKLQPSRGAHRCKSYDDADAHLCVPRILRPNTRGSSCSNRHILLSVPRSDFRNRLNTK